MYFMKKIVISFMVNLAVVEAIVLFYVVDWQTALKCIGFSICFSFGVIVLPYIVKQLRAKKK